MTTKRLRQTKLTGFRPSKKKAATKKSVVDVKKDSQSPSPSPTPSITREISHDQLTEEEDDISHSAQTVDKRMVNDDIDRRKRARRETRHKDIKIHQEGLSEHEKLLRAFDLNYDFGPCVGITRLERWERAESLGLHPPKQIKRFLLRQGDSRGVFEGSTASS